MRARVVGLLLSLAAFTAAQLANINANGVITANGAFVRELSDSRTFCRQADVDAMRALGAQIDYRNGYYFASAPAGGMRGASISNCFTPGASVWALTIRNIPSPSSRDVNRGANNGLRWLTRSPCDDCHLSLRCAYG